MKERVEVTPNQPRTYLEIQLNSGEIAQNKQLTNTREKSQNLVHTEETVPTQPTHTCTTENKRRWTDLPSDIQLVGRTHQRKTQQQ